MNGTIVRYSSEEAIAPLTIHTYKGNTHYFVKIVDWTSNETVMTIFVRAGQSATTTIPLGSYRIKYAVGDVWYGESYLFGPETVYTMADKRLEFTQSGDEVSGFTIKLFLQPDGNLHLTRMRKGDF